MTTYEVAEAPFYSARLDELLAAGWEPFGVIPGSPPGQNDRVALRREAENSQSRTEAQ